MFYVVCANVYGASERVEEFKTKPEALEFIQTLPEDIYMVILRNDDLSFASLRQSK